MRRDGTPPEHRVFRDLPDLLSPGDLLVLNRSRVLPARLLGRRDPSGGQVEILLVRHLEGERWEALVRPGRRLRPTDAVDVSGELRVEILGEGAAGDARRPVRLLCAPERLPELLDRIGHAPLPPYVRRAATAADRERYQTVYARERGSVAAPTAGLHFTPALLQRLAERGISTAELVLHVGFGTFKPVQVERVEEHRVEPERAWIPPEAAAAIRRTRAAGGRVVAVGTTTVRTLEAATSRSDDGSPAALDGEIDLTILPGHRFRAVDALVTNFHLPRSSLLMLVAAFAGRERVLEVYTEAVNRGYRFYSYGDAMLVL